jgi:CheY-like chemotaxis protein
MLPELRMVYIEDSLWNRKVVELLIIHVLKAGQFAMFEDSANILAKMGALSWKPDIILADIHMKPYDGFEVLKLIRQQKEYDGIKVVAVTAGVTDDDVENLDQAGFDGVIAKPIDPDHFTEHIARIMGGERAWIIT